MTVGYIMPDWSAAHETTLRFGFFFAVLIFMAVLEWLYPRRKLTVSKYKRWVSNLSINFFNSLFIRVLVPISAITIALYAQHAHQGLFNILNLSTCWSITLSIIILDLAIYLQHVMFHALPIFWRFHRMHHVDLDLDVTSGVRFHPLEIFLSLFIKFAVILLIGAPASAVLIFQILLNATSMFSHSNVHVPTWIDRRLRWLVVTPDMHRVHHSRQPQETNSNFGFNLSLWDRLFGTYIEEPELGQEQMILGLDTINKPFLCLNLLGMLWVPLIKENPEYPINKRG